MTTGDAQQRLLTELERALSPLTADIEDLMRELLGYEDGDEVIARCLVETELE